MHYYTYFQTNQKRVCNHTASSLERCSYEHALRILRSCNFLELLTGQNIKRVKFAGRQYVVCNAAFVKWHDLGVVNSGFEHSQAKLSNQRPGFLL